MTTTDPANQPTSSSGWLAYAAPTTASDRQPATPGQALRWYASREDVVSSPEGQAWAAKLRRWADELDAAPATYRLPPEPPETVTELWDPDGAKFTRRADDGSWVHQDDDPDTFGGSFLEVLQAAGRLSTAPPPEYNPPTVHGCDDCSVEPGETHRWPGCPGARRARERLSTAPPAGTEEP